MWVRSLVPAVGLSRRQFPIRDSIVFSAVPVSASPIPFYHKVLTYHQGGTQYVHDSEVD